MAELSFEVVTPEGLKVQADVYEVLLPTPEGTIGVLPHHIPLITIVVPGVISIRHREQDADEALEHLASSGGFVEIDGKRVRVLADSAERAEDIDELKVKEALERARELRSAARDQVSLADALSLLEHQIARLKVAELKRRRRP